MRRRPPPTKITEPLADRPHLAPDHDLRPTRHHDVELVLGMRRLRVDRAGLEDVQPAGQVRDREELVVQPAARRSARLRARPAPRHPCPEPPRPSGAAPAVRLTAHRAPSRLAFRAMRRAIGPWASLAGCRRASPSPLRGADPSPAPRRARVGSPVEPPSVDRRAAAARPGPSPPAPLRRLAIEPVVDGLDGPLDIAWRAGRSGDAVRRRAGRADPDRPRRAAARAAIPRHRGSRDGRRRAGPARSRVPAGPPERPVLRLLHRRSTAQQVVASYDTIDGDRDAADPDSGRRSGCGWPTGSATTTAGRSCFGPDGYLYIGTGDGGGGGDPLDSGRHLDTLLAKVLRIDVAGDQPAADPRYAIPADNPFVDTAGARPGDLRSPGCAIRGASASTAPPATCGSATSGQGEREEIDVVRAGVERPRLRLEHDGGHRLLPGRGDRLRDAGPDPAGHGVRPRPGLLGHRRHGLSRRRPIPALQGWYVFSDYCSGAFWAIDALEGSDRRAADRRATTDLLDQRDRRGHGRRAVRDGPVAAVSCCGSALAGG